MCCSGAARRMAMSCAVARATSAVHLNRARDHHRMADPPVDAVFRRRSVGMIDQRVKLARHQRAIQCRRSLPANPEPARCALQDSRNRAAAAQNRQRHRLVERGAVHRSVRNPHGRGRFQPPHCSWGTAVRRLMSLPVPPSDSHRDASAIPTAGGNQALEPSAPAVCCTGSLRSTTNGKTSGPAAPADRMNAIAWSTLQSVATRRSIGTISR